MTTIRVARRHRFTSIDRRTINDHRLSFRARGVLVWLLDKPDDWHSTSVQIAREAKEGRDAVRAALAELETAGYLVRSRIQDRGTGRWRTEQTVHEVPVPEPGNPKPGNPASEIQAVKPLKTVTENCATPICSDTQDACSTRTPELLRRAREKASAMAARRAANQEGTPTP